MLHLADRWLDFGQRNADAAQFRGLEGHGIDESANGGSRGAIANAGKAGCWAVAGTGLTLLAAEGLPWLCGRLRIDGAGKKAAAELLKRRGHCKFGIRGGFRWRRRGLRISGRELGAGIGERDRNHGVGHRGRARTFPGGHRKFRQHRRLDTGGSNARITSPKHVSDRSWRGQGGSGRPQRRSLLRCR
jgi:hypothetical protein